MSHENTNTSDNDNINTNNTDLVSTDSENKVVNKEKEENNKLLFVNNICFPNNVL